ncbi:MAG: GTPase domain-containing protein [Bdellovibrionota bacterium]
MAVFNYAGKEINAKIVYYGPGRSGKTTNIQYIHAKLKPEHKSELVTLSTEQDRTLFFDFLPLDLGSVRGLQTRFHLYTVPGQVFYNSTRKLVLKNADGVVFVADCQRKYWNDTIESFNNLVENLRGHGKNITDVPVVIQYNKRDMPDAVAVADLEAVINKHGFPHVEAVASQGEGVLQTLQLVSKQVVQRLQEAAMEPARPAPPPPAPKPAPPPQASLDNEEEAALGRLGESTQPLSAPAAAPARPSSIARPPLASVAAPSASGGAGNAGLEFVRAHSPAIGPTGEVRFTVELRDPATGKIYSATVKLQMDKLVPVR